jgi:anti-sigma-K factor RskA
MAPVLHELSGAYALDALDAAERQRFEEHLDSCARCQDEVRSFQSVAVRLASLAEVAPPPHLAAAVLARASSGTQAVPTPLDRGRAGAVVGSGSARTVRGRRLPASRSWSRPGSARRRWVAVAAIAAVGLGAIGVSVRLVQVEDRLDRYHDVAEVAMAPGAQVVHLRGTAGSATVILAAEQGKALVSAEDLAPVPGNSTYQMWLLSDGPPAPAGLFRPGAAGRVATVLDVDVPTGAGGLGVTVEPRRGSLAPTTPVILSGELAEG